MKALVTGGSGYFGSLLIEKLLAQGHNCASFDINVADDLSNGVLFYQGDIRNFDAVRAAMENVDVVFHNVAQVPLAKDKHLFRSVNIDGTRNVLAAAMEAGVGKVVYTSSSAVFGAPKENPVTELTPPAPAEAYGQAKLEGELLCHEFAAKGLDVSIIRPRTIMGHGRLGIFQILFEWIREGANVPVLGKGDNLYQFIHADDLAEACILASMRAGCSVYNCGTDRFSSMRSTLEALCRHAGTGAKVVSVPMGPTVVGMQITSALGLSPLGPYHSLMYGRSMYFDIVKAREELNWSPAYSNEQMFIDSYDWYLKNRDTVLRTTMASHHRSPVKQGILRAVKWVL